MGFVASNRMKLTTKKPIECTGSTPKLGCDALAGSGSTSLLMRPASLGGVLLTCRFRLSCSVRLSVSSELERCRCWISVLEWLLATGASIPLRCFRGCGAVANTSTAINTRAADSVTGQRWTTLVDITRGRK